MAETDTSGRGATRNFGAIVEILALVLMIGTGLVAWVVGIVTRGYDYDEVLRAHSIWLTSQGLRPYSDFFECHPPYFVLLSPVVRACADPVDALLALRLVSAAGNLVFLGALVTLGSMSLPAEASRRWAWLGLALIAFNSSILDFLVEFRIDGWGYGLIAWSAVRYSRRNAGLARQVEFGALTALSAALFCPKLVLLPPLIAFLDLVMRFESWRGFLRAGLAYLAGVVLAAAIFLGYLLANRIGVERTSLLLGRYHAVSNAHAGFRYGLFVQIVSMWPLLLIVAGMAGWAWGWLRRRKLTSSYEPALALWLVLQMFLVAYPYKQYYAPWFLLASGFLPSLGPIIAVLLKRGQAIVYVVACVVSIYGSSQVASYWVDTAVAKPENSVIRWMNKVSSPEDRVVGAHPFHPIDRYDTFFLSFNTSDKKGFDSERIFEALPGLRPYVTEARYRAELDANPPALVVLDSLFFEVTHPALQSAVLEDYILRHGYRNVRFGYVLFALRPDRYEHALRNGYLH